MKCPVCLGKGYATDEDIKEYPHRCPNCNGKGFYSVDWQKVRCEVCNGSGKKPMTIEEYLRSANVNDMARCIATKLCELAKREYGIYDVVDYATIFEWLKQPHTTKE